MKRNQTHKVANIHQLEGITFPENYKNQTLKNLKDGIGSKVKDSTRPKFSGNASEEVEFFEADANADINAVFMTIISMFTPEGQALPKNTAISLYGSAMSVAYPDLKDIVSDVLKMQGLRLSPVRLPSEAEGKFITMVTNASDGKCIVMLGELILMLFKNLTAANFTNFMQRWIIGMCSQIRHTVEQNDPLMVTSDVLTVQRIKTVFGGNQTFRVAVLKKVIQGWSLVAPYDALFNYIGSILRYTDMSSFTFIAETLMLHKSPVLRHPDVQHEVENLADAYYAISKCPYPQYFGIMAKPSVGKLLERARFPILLTVAQQLKSESYTTIKRFISATYVQNPIVKKLVLIHKNFMSNKITKDTIRTFGVDANFEEDVARYLSVQEEQEDETEGNPPA